jgi:hypothetical protein
MRWATHVCSDCNQHACAEVPFCWDCPVTRYIVLQEDVHREIWRRGPKIATAWFGRYCIAEVSHELAIFAGEPKFARHRQQSKGPTLGRTRTQRDASIGLSQRGSATHDRQGDIHYPHLPVHRTTHSTFNHLQVVSLQTRHTRLQAHRSSTWTAAAPNESISAPHISALMGRSLLCSHAQQITGSL